MKKYFIAIFLMLFSIFVVPLSTKVSATGPPKLAAPSGLSLIELKITGNEFIMLQNNTDSTITDLNNYWLYVFNNNDPTVSGTNSSIQQLPVGTLSPKQTILLSANGGATCGAAVTAKLSVSLNDTSGYLQVVHVGFTGGLLLQTASDSTSWTSSSTYNVSASTIIVPTSSSSKTTYVSYRYQYSASPAIYWWQPADVSDDTCRLTVSSATPLGVDNISSINQLLPGSLPPATFVSAPDDNTSSKTSTIPASDIGLAAPRITELLPNPAQPKMDAENEFIELYNPNDKVFDLSGFMIEIGLTTKHDYTFPSGTLIPAKSFKAFFSEDTNLSLSNSGGQAWLLDPMNNIISQTESYGTAKDGQTWALGPDGKWYWSMTSTPNAANIVLIPSTSSKKGSSVSSSKTPKTATKGSSTSDKNTLSNATATGSQATGGSKLHLWILAVIGAGALLYAVYEYRNDLANLFYRVRRYRETRRTPRQDS